MEHDARDGDGARKNSGRRRFVQTLVVAAVLYFIVAYVAMPFFWKEYTHRHPWVDDNPRITTTGDGHAGDPLNVALIGSEAEIVAIMHAAGWFPATALGIESDLKIAADVVVSRPDDEAPVSSLYLFGRKEDLAYEQPVGDNPRQRHHVRFWKTSSTSSNGEPVWIGSASYDERAGLSHTTGQFTHHIAPDIDKERDHLFDDLKKTGDLSDFDVVADFHTEHEGRNGGGDVWRTDGSLYVGTLLPPTDATR